MAGTGSYVAGLQGGYNHVFKSHWMLGFETDASFPNSDVVIPYSVRGSQTVTSPLTGEVTYGEAVIYSGTVRARVGYAFDHFLLYGTGGLAWTYDQVTRTQVAGFPVGGTADARHRGQSVVLAIRMGGGRRCGNSTDRELDREGRISLDRIWPP